LMQARNHLRLVIKSQPVMAHNVYEEHIGHYGFG